MGAGTSMKRMSKVDFVKKPMDSVGLLNKLVLFLCVRGSSNGVLCSLPGLS
uniref:Uncharacterized protein n=1 Tax=Anguilla anguilla TaxID=7936 RepID=A0A0E9T3T2_ANGAN